MSDDSLLCPSAQPDQDDARVFGVQAMRPDRTSHVGYLTEALPVSPEVLALSGAAQAPEVLRIAAPCQLGGCTHYAGGACSLGERVSRMLDPVVGALPRCAIRPSCRWFSERGPAACLRCPQVVTNAREGAGIPLEVAFAQGRVPDR